MCRQFPFPPYAPRVIHRVLLHTWSEPFMRFPKGMFESSRPEVRRCLYPLHFYLKSMAFCTVHFARRLGMFCEHPGR